jgi:hypothetical protein
MRNNGQKRPPWWPNRQNIAFYFDADTEAQTKVDSELIVYRYLLINSEVSLRQSDSAVRNNDRKKPPWWPNKQPIAFCASDDGL